jgi:hypothetical protein
MNTSSLILGWKVDSERNPLYWISGNPTPGQQPDDALITVKSEHIAAHTAIIAQSGSGKSFFLGRFIEEILLKTKARCLIFDPNADFRRVYQVESEDLWTKAQYNSKTKIGKLPNEAERDTFFGKWSQIPIVVRSRIIDEKDPHDQLLHISAESLPFELFCEDSSSEMHLQLNLCHAFVHTLLPLFFLVSLSSKNNTNILDIIEFYLSKAVKVGESLQKLQVELEYKYDLEFLKAGFAIIDGTMSEFGQRNPFLISYLQDLLQPYSDEDLKTLIHHRIKSAFQRCKYISDHAKQSYISRLKSLQASGILNPYMTISSSTLPKRLEVIDLPSISDKFSRFLVVGSILENEWNVARETWRRALKEPQSMDSRVPLFIVVDEAHHLMPAGINSSIENHVRDMFRTIIAEGRKYGIFLIIVSQRPDKLDPMILSECENRALMKLSNDSVCKTISRICGIDNTNFKQLEDIQQYEPGRVLLHGKWAVTEPLILYSAARRTVEGGRNLRKEHWATKS